ncbi:MAG: response regulator transcription factor [Defluviitaleaceae bacterium]|nr:response regulator transcription factor [Defluviitaleaceae bacterium]
MTLLLVEDNPHIMHINRDALTAQGYHVIEAGSISQCQKILQKESPDLILLDILLPDGNGLKFCEELRKCNSENARIPILILSALDEKDEIIAGLKAGGDDYLAKPHDIHELVMRIESLLRRVRFADESAEKRMTSDLICGSIVINRNTARAFIDGVDLLLHKKEFELLCLFVQNKDRAIQAEELYQKIWAMPMGDDSQALRSAISRLRTKIADSGHTITKERGGGYCFHKEL